MKDRKQIQQTFDDAVNEMELFVAEDNTGHATVEIDGHVETHSLDSPEFGRILRVLSHRKSERLLGNAALKETIDLLKAHAQVHGETIEVQTRSASQNGKTYLDSGDTDWSVIEVSPDGHKTLAAPPEGLKFVRARGMKNLPTPVHGGSLDLLKKFLNLRDQSQFYLLIVWILAAIHPLGPYMILVLNGEAGSSKSTLTQILRWLIDPNVAPLRSLPKSERDLFIAAKNAWLTAIDNISFLSDDMSDAFCRLSTRAAFVTRKLYTDSAEQFFDVCRPALFNGIQDFCFRTDFIDRSLQLTLARISDSQRKSSQEIKEEFEAEKSKIYGALLEALSATMRELPNITTNTLPRMADFGLFALATEKALGWPEGSVNAAYEKMRRGANEAVLESCPYLEVVYDLADKTWQGPAAQLMDQIERRYCDDIWKRKGFPKGLPQLSGQLVRLAPAFRTRNVEIMTGKTSGTGSERFISFGLIDPNIPAGHCV